MMTHPEDAAGSQLPAPRRPLLKKITKIIETIELL
jgi:hypothetical protein